MGHVHNFYRCDRIFVAALLLHLLLYHCRFGGHQFGNRHLVGDLLESGRENERGIQEGLASRLGEEKVRQKVTSRITEGHTDCERGNSEERNGDLGANPSRRVAKNGNLS